MELTYKEFFEKSKMKPYLQEIVDECVITGIKVALSAEKVFPNSPKPDAGELALNGLDMLCKLEDIVLTNREEITAEYMSGVLNSYGKNIKLKKGKGE